MVFVRNTILLEYCIMSKKPKLPKLCNGLYVKELYVRIEGKITVVIGAQKADILYIGNNPKPILRNKENE